MDDDIGCLGLIECILKEGGHTARAFRHGSDAIAAALTQPPALFLLDVDMGEMNGFELCSRLKAEPRLASRPVIFISGADDTEAKVHGFRCGGVDYITKPFHLEEVLARVRTHLQIHHLQEELAEHNRQLEAKVRRRTSELASARRRLAILDQAKSDFLTLISHELRTPLTGLLGFTDLVLLESAHLPNLAGLKQPYEESRRRLMNIVEDALLLSRIDVEAEKFELSTASLENACGLALSRVQEFAQSRRVSFATPPTITGWVHGSEELLVKALGALIDTAVKFAAPDSTVTLAVHPPPAGAAHGMVEIVLGAQGRIIPPRLLTRFFDVLAIGESLAPGGDLGLEPPVAERIIALCGGTVQIENLEPAGIRLRVRLRPAPAPVF